MENQDNNKKGKDPAMKGKDFISQFSDEGKADGQLGDPASSDIPEFDLANQIMAQHRKQTAGKRKGPGKAVKPLRSRDESYKDRQRFINVLAPNNEVIREVVKRDIEKLCRGEKVEY